MTAINFTKMHGLGNDFILIDGTIEKFSPDSKQIVQWGNRNKGIGFDQLLLVEPSDLAGCDFKYRIFNRDGQEVEQCGNGARCFAKYVYEKGLTTKKTLRVETKAGIIILTIADDGLISVNMGQPRLALQDIPFKPKQDNTNLRQVVTIAQQEIEFIAVNMGNPHAVIMVANVEDAPVALWGSQIESHPQFAEKTNVEFVQIINRRHIKLRVFERGVGETLACGTGACAAVVAGVMAGVLDKKVQVSLLGGDLTITWQQGEVVIMTGPAEFVFDGKITQ